MKTNCPNCGAPIDNRNNKCLYCGTSYIDMSFVDFENEKPFYLKIKYNGYIITQLVKPELNQIISESNKIDVCGGIHNNILLHSYPISHKFQTDVSFHAIENEDGELAIIERCM